MNTVNDWLNGGRYTQAVIHFDMPVDVLEILSDSLNAATAAETASPVANVSGLVSREII